MAIFAFSNYSKEDIKMKKEKPQTVDAQQAAQSQSADQPRTNRIHLTLVTEEEREKYRVPSYDYLLP